jgi:hypothetical protein
MGILLGHGAHIGDIVSHDHVAEIEVSSWAKGKMADDETIGSAAVLVEKDKVSDLGRNGED